MNELSALQDKGQDFVTFSLNGQLIKIKADTFLLPQTQLSQKSDPEATFYPKQPLKKEFDLSLGHQNFKNKVLLDMVAAFLIVSIIGLGGYFGLQKCRQMRENNKKDSRPTSPTDQSAEETNNDERHKGKHGDIPISLYDEFESERVESHSEIGQAYEGAI